MAARSPSPNLSRSSSNPRTPDPVRRLSKDLHQRNPPSKSGGAGSSPRAPIEHRENERDGNCSNRARSPVTPSSRGGAAAASKNFMAPTISAASKVIVASPKRKILGERNEVVRSSLESLPYSSSGSPTKKDDALARSEVHSGVMACSKELNSIPKSDFDDKKQDFGSVSNFLPKFHLSPAAAPLDGDPSLPPYDPKTNYLSPRPRFLHYRPNPRIEHYRHGELDFLEMDDGRQLDDSLSMESGKDVIARHSDDEQSSLAVKDFGEQFKQFSDPIKESDDDFAHSESQSIEYEDGSCVLGPESARRPSRNGCRSFLFKFAPFLMLISACLFLPIFFDSPAISSSTITRAPLLQVMHISMPLRNYIAAFTVNIKKLASGPAHLSGTKVSTLPSEPFGPILLANLTIADYNQRVEAEYILSRTLLSHNMASQRSETVQTLVGDTEEEEDLDADEKEIELAKESDLEVKISGQDELGHENLKSDLMTTQSNMEQTSLGDIKEEALVTEEEESKLSKESYIEVEVVSGEDCSGHDAVGVKEKVDAMMIDEIMEDAIVENNCIEDNKSAEVEAGGDVDISALAGTEYGMVGGDQEDSFVGSGSQKSIEERTDVVEVEKMYDFSNDIGTVEDHQDSIVESGSEQKIIEHVVKDVEVIEVERTFEEAENPHHYLTYFIGIFSALLLAVPSLIILYKKQKQIPLADAMENSPSKALSQSVSGSSESYTQKRGSPYQSSPVENPMVSDQGVSEFSSSLQPSSSVGRRSTASKDKEETLSMERRPRRDSTVSSSSISYGSFTTYERIPIKKGARDEEAVTTPVRRSSRIRNQIASPQRDVNILSE